MASQVTMEAAARESRANAREDMAILTSGAREKVDNAFTNVQALGQKMIHPFDKKSREEVQTKAEEQKQQTAQKWDQLRSTAVEQAEKERLAARHQVAQQLIAGVGGARYVEIVSGGGQNPPPHMPQPQIISGHESDQGSSEHGQTGAGAGISQSEYEPHTSNNEEPHLEHTHEFKRRRNKPMEGSSGREALNEFKDRRNEPMEGSRSTEALNEERKEPLAEGSPSTEALNEERKEPIAEGTPRREASDEERNEP